MNALIRLAYKQGLLTGANQSDVQEFALLSVLQQENEEKGALEEARFRSMIIAMHPDKAKQILDVLDSNADDGGFAPELTDEEMENYEPISVEEASEAIAMLRRFGVAVQ